MTTEFFELNDKVKVIVPDTPLTGRTGIVTSLVYQKHGKKVFDVGVDMKDSHHKIDLAYFKPEELQKLHA